MRSRQGFTIIEVVIVLAVVVMVVIGGILYWQSRQPAPSNHDVTTSTPSPTPDPTAAWLNFSSDTNLYQSYASFDFRYDPTWTQKKTSSVCAFEFRLPGHNAVLCPTISYDLDNKNNLTTYMQEARARIGASMQNEHSLEIDLHKAIWYETGPDADRTVDLHVVIADVKTEKYMNASQPRHIMEVIWYNQNGQFVTDDEKSLFRQFIHTYTFD